MSKIINAEEKYFYTKIKQYLFLLCNSKIRVDTGHSSLRALVICCTYIWNWAQNVGCLILKLIIRVWIENHNIFPYCDLLDYNTGRWISVFWRKNMLPSSGFYHEDGECMFLLDVVTPYQIAAQYHNPEYDSLNLHHCRNLKFYYIVISTATSFSTV
jgi:hypothetical protein